MKFKALLVLALTGLLTGCFEGVTETGSTSPMPGYDRAMDSEYGVVCYHNTYSGAVSCIKATK